MHLQLLLFVIIIMSICTVLNITTISHSIRLFGIISITLSSNNFNNTTAYLNASCKEILRNSRVQLFYNALLL